MKTTLVIVLIIAALAVVGFGAYQFGQSAGLTEAQNIRGEFFQSRTGTTTQSPQAGQGGTGQGGTNVRSQAGRPMATGTIASIEGDVVKLTQADGTSVIIALSGQTTVQKITTGKAADLQVGQHVTVQGVQATGQVNAQLIQISPAAQ